MIELKIRLQPKQKLFSWMIELTPITFYGGAKGGGKSKGLQLIMLLRRFKYASSHGAIFRRTYAELEGNHIRPLFESYPELKEFWHESKKLLTLPNGSTLQFCHCSNENDVDLYQGREFHDLAIDEAGQWTEGMFRKLHGSNRSSNPNIKARTILTGNPGGVGHGWLKRLFIDKRFNEREKPEDYTFIQALVDDNEALMASDPDYVRRLEAEPNEALRKAFRHGDWNVFAGQFFQEVSKQIHFIKAFDIPRHWNRFGAYDFGFNHPSAFGWFATDEDGNTHLYREFVKAGQRVDQFARELNRFSDTATLYPIVAGHDCWTTRNILKADASPPTIAEQFQLNGIQLMRANNDRLQGAAQLRAYLAWQGRPDSKPRFFLHDSCPISFDTLSRMIHDPDRVEDVLKVDATDGDPSSGDDAYDMIRYGLMSRPYLSQPLAPLATDIQNQEQKHIEAAMEKVKREQSLRNNYEDNLYGAWGKDKRGIPDWNKW